LDGLDVAREPGDDLEEAGTERPDGDGDRVEAGGGGAAALRDVPVRLHAVGHEEHQDQRERHDPVAFLHEETTRGAESTRPFDGRPTGAGGA
jgi:hypothetical protein